MWLCKYLHESNAPSSIKQELYLPFLDSCLYYLSKDLESNNRMKLTLCGRESLQLVIESYTVTFIQAERNRGSYPMLYINTVGNTACENR